VPPPEPVTDNLRIYGSLRTAHLERLARMEPARMLFTGARYDFEPDAVDLAEEPVQLGEWAVVGHLLRHHYDVVEVNEPAMVDRWKYLVPQLAAIRVRSLLSRRRTVVTTYCIENADPVLKVAQRWRIAPPTGRLLVALVLRLLVAGIDRIAFGTEGSVEMYERYVGARRLGARSALFEAVPSACACLEGADDVRLAHQLLFIGSFVERKGVAELMATWDAVRRLDPDATLVVIGKGRLEPQVLAWATTRPEVTVEIDPPRAGIHRALRESGALILLSQPDAAWREQIGLPILEGLGHGCEVIASTETGLAAWLTGHGHTVVAPDAAPDEVARRVLEAFGRTGGRTGSLEDLPGEDQRIVADRWMMTGSVSG
jgi:glycosyltransferase involved in cell wall biosynthesis